MKSTVATDPTASPRRATTLPSGCHPLLLRASLECGGDRRRASQVALDLSLDPEDVFAESDELSVRGSAEGAERLEVVDRLEEVRLPLGIAAHERDPFSGEA